MSVSAPTGACKLSLYSKFDRKVALAVTFNNCHFRHRSGGFLWVSNESCMKTDFWGGVGAMHAPGVNFVIAMRAGCERFAQQLLYP